MTSKWHYVLVTFYFDLTVVIICLLNGAICWTMTDMSMFSRDDVLLCIQILKRLHIIINTLICKYFLCRIYMFPLIMFNVFERIYTFQRL